MAAEWSSVGRGSFSLGPMLEALETHARISPPASETVGRRINAQRAPFAVSVGL